jgi:hypothetical protein
MDLLNVDRCVIAQIIGESNRYIWHLLLIHVTTSVFDGDSNIFGNDLLRKIIITALAIILYHILIRKLVEPHVKKMKTICYIDKRDKYNKP